MKLFEVVNIGTGEVLASLRSKKDADAWAFQWSHGILFNSEVTLAKNGSGKVLGWDKPQVLLVEDNE